MEKTFKSECPHCGTRVGPIPESYQSSEVDCPKCGMDFLAFPVREAVRPTPVPKPAPKPPQMEGRKALRIAISNLLRPIARALACLILSSACGISSVIADKLGLFPFDVILVVVSLLLPLVAFFFAIEAMLRLGGVADALRY